MSRTPTVLLPRVRAVVWARMTPWLLDDVEIVGGSVAAVYDALRELPGTIGIQLPLSRRGQVVRGHLTRVSREREERHVCGELLVYAGLPAWGLAPAQPRSSGRRPTLVHGVDEIDRWEA